MSWHNVNQIWHDSDSFYKEVYSLFVDGDMINHMICILFDSNYICIFWIIGEDGGDNIFPKSYKTTLHI